MNKIESLEQYANVILNVLNTLSNGARVTNDSYPVFEAPAPRAVVPEWRFSCYPSYHNNGTVSGLQLGVHVHNATMGGYSKYFAVSDPGEIAPALNDLETFRQEALSKCRHYNHRHVANLGRCYNQYQCNDCGIKFEIDSGD